MPRTKGRMKRNEEQRQRRLTEQQRLLKNEGYRKRRANATAEQRRRILEVHRNRLARMTEDKKAEIRQKDSERRRQRVKNMTEEERNQLREKNAEVQKRRRANKTEEELAFERLMQDDKLKLPETEPSCESVNSAINQTAQAEDSSMCNNKSPVVEASASLLPIITSHECPHCPNKQKFPFRSGLERHLMLMHKNEMDNSCQACGSKYNNEFAVHQHHMSKKCLSQPFVPVEIPIRPRTKKVPRTVTVKQIEHKAQTCPHCARSFVYRSQLDKHLIEKHTKELDNLCERCGSKYANNFRDHEHHLNNKCSNQNMKATSSDIEVISPVQTKSACEKCGKFYTIGTAMKQHLRVNHAIVVPQLNCRTCGFIAATAEGLLEHKQDSHTKEAVSCECGNTYKSPRNYYRHIKSCPGFKQTDPSKIQAPKNIEIKPPEIKPTCMKCGKIFINYFYLKNHMRVEHGFDKEDKPKYVSPYIITKKISKVKAQPKIQAVPILLIQPVPILLIQAVPILSIQCTKCIQKFKSEVERTIHNRTHGKNFGCTLCRGTFETLDGLNIHRNQAHGISLCDVIPGQTKRQYVCSVCDQGFLTSTGLKNHQELIHPYCFPQPLVIETYNYTVDSNTNVAVKSDSHAEQIDYDDEQEEVEQEFTAFECKVCSTIFLTTEDLENHEAEEHHINLEEECPIKSEIKLEVSESEEPDEEDTILQPEFIVPMLLEEGDPSAIIIPSSVLKMEWNLK